MRRTVPLGRPPELEEVWHGTRNKILVEDNSCWTWIGKRNPVNGYGPYRRLYERYVGDVPSGVDLHHVCFRGPQGCVNPAHLKLVESGFHRASHLRQFTVRQLEEIRRLAAVPGMRVQDIAAKFGVPRTTIQNIVNGKRYREFEMETKPQHYCEHCGAPVAGRRRNAIFCSVEHRVASNYIRRYRRKHPNAHHRATTDVPHTLRGDE